MQSHLINYFFSSLISFSLVFSPAVKAQDAVPIEEGELAPFSGTLLTDDAAATLLSEIKTCSESAESDLQFEIDRNKALYDLDIELLQIRLDSQQERYEIMLHTQDEQLDYLLSTNTNSRIPREVLFIAGVGSGILVTVAAAYGLSSASNLN